MIFVGYRVKSQRGIEFRQWADKVLNDGKNNMIEYRNRSALTHYKVKMSKRFFRRTNRAFLRYT
ncbi:MAG: virulence RhuM family protein [Lachnospiraceae bacterium]|nr:virulence RhuM family protein [Lachnospiraceae bacterium]